MTLAELIKLVVEGGSLVAVVFLFLRHNSQIAGEATQANARYAERLERIGTLCHSTQSEMQAGYRDALQDSVAAFERALDRIERVGPSRGPTRP